MNNFRIILLKSFTGLALTGPIIINNNDNKNNNNIESQNFGYLLQNIASSSVSIDIAGLVVLILGLTLVGAVLIYLLIKKLSNEKASYAEMIEEEEILTNIWNDWKYSRRAKSQHGTAIPEDSPTHAIWKGDDEIKRAIIIGDVHGCCEELEELLKKCSFNEKTDTLIFVGDLVNKGPDNIGVLKLVRKLNAWVVRGNHDDKAVFVAVQSKVYPTQKKDTFSWTSELGVDDIQYLNKLPYSLKLPERFSKNNQPILIVHAGIVPGVDLENQKLEDMTTMRALKKQNDKFIAKEKLKDAIPWASQWNGPYHIYFGHDAKGGLQKFPYATGLDTGCCYGRQLTAAILPEGNIVQVSAKKVYSKP
eukprot:c13209_g1_i3.p1 GENE.c13209_g1_i3~~c13209_g1_i3.p1  ORF type:complete len:371 (+),score=180.01 c13209_g1_i3:28-1113(+)